jgi:hypothetical protein
MMGLRFVPRFVGNGKLLASFPPSASKYGATTGRGHPLPETMLVPSLPVGWLKCTLHNNDCFERAKLVIFLDKQFF